MPVVISLGGSIVAPAEGPDPRFLLRFRNVLLSVLEKSGDRAILVVGGGSPARKWQNAYKEFHSVLQSETSYGNGDRALEVFASMTPNMERQKSMQEALDRIGIAATRLNAQLIREVFLELCPQEVVIDPTAEFEFKGRILVASGWKPGFSTDYDAVILAERFKANRVINLSNVAQIYDDDPRKNPFAKPLKNVTYDVLLKMTGTEWNPGANVPFDPIALAKAKEIGLEIIFASGTELDNFRAILESREFVGTIIHG
ncbi:MAG: UMP kinase [Rectinema sp.]|nr:UMP kinase [Rectinema sp.]